MMELMIAFIFILLSVIGLIFLALRVIKVESYTKSYKGSFKRVHRRIEETQKRFKKFKKGTKVEMDALNEKIDSILLNTSRLKWIGIGALSFYVLDKFGGLGAIKMALGFVL